jgi:SAM-dependent methyltransferase
VTSTLQEYGPIQDDYSFFQAHSTEAEQDVRAYLATVRGLGLDAGPVRLLDFGCGDGKLTADFLTRVRLPPSRLRVDLVEPDEAYRRSAAERVRPFTAYAVPAHPCLPPGRGADFDLVLSNHALYYVPDLPDTAAELLEALAPGGVFITAMAGRRNAWVQLWDQCFAWLGRPTPYHTSEGLEAYLVSRGIAYGKSDVWYELAFPDAADNRLKICRFLLGASFLDMPRDPMLALFDRYSSGGHIRMSVVHEQFLVRRDPVG